MKRDDTPQALDAVWKKSRQKFFAEQGVRLIDITAHQSSLWALSHRST